MRLTNKVSVPRVRTKVPWSGPTVFMEVFAECVYSDDIDVACDSGCDVDDSKLLLNAVSATFSRSVACVVARVRVQSSPCVVC